MESVQTGQWLSGWGSTFVSLIKLTDLTDSGMIYSVREDYIVLINQSYVYFPIKMSKK